MLAAVGCVYPMVCAVWCDIIIYTEVSQRTHDAERYTVQLCRTHALGLERVAVGAVVALVRLGCWVAGGEDGTIWVGGIGSDQGWTAMTNFCPSKKK